jgi:hypothetical protein
LGIPIVLDNLLDFKYLTRAVIFEKGNKNVLHRIKPLQRVDQFLNCHAIQLLSIPPKADVPLGKRADVAGLYSWRSVCCIATDVPVDLYRMIQKRVGEGSGDEH